MFIRRKHRIAKYLIAAGAVIYCEWFVYVIQPLFWQELECPSPDDCTKILFIADPQIQGDLDAPSPLNHLFSWDSDRYLKSTFSVAVQNFKPDVLVYLGDLMDEGSVSTMPQFHGYAKRIFNIFEVNYHVTQIWVPGDNDIGGEDEPVRKDKVMEFQKIFEQPCEITFKNITFYKVNGITHAIADASEWKDDTYKIVVSHYPTTYRQYFGQKVHQKILPNIYFCAHDHESKYVTQLEDFTSRATRRLNYEDKKVLDIPSSDKLLYEIYVPTCSYRMGTTTIGYGAAVVDNRHQRLRYTVLWSPGRFPSLYLYLAILVFFFAYFLIFFMFKCFCNRNMKSRKHDSEMEHMLKLI